jgi:ornithine cyclodeaminase
VTFVTQVWTRTQIQGVLGAVDLISAMERAFTAYSRQQANVPPVGELIFDSPPGDAHIKYGYIRGDDVFVVKVATGFYANPRSGLPANSGVMLVFSARSGLLEAVLLDEGYLTNVRTAAAGAVAARYLAPRPVERIGICGTGVQARMQLEFLQPVTPCREVIVWGRSRIAAQNYAEEMRQQGFRVALADGPAEVAATSNLIITTTAATQPFLRARDLPKGVHITAMGSDTPDKNELAPDVLAACDLCVVDSLAQCRERGELHHAMKSGLISDRIAVELGSIVAGEAAGRTSPEEVTVCDLTGVAVQDIEICKAVLRELQRDGVSRGER